MGHAQFRNMIDKQRLIGKLIKEVEKDLDVLKRAALEAREAATHSESKQEGKYDTRALEASYLAGAQAKRAFELESYLHSLKNLDAKIFFHDDEIRATALIEVQIQDQRQFFFLIPQGGGITLEEGKTQIKVIGANSPLGGELLGRRVQECFELQINGIYKEFEILNIF